MSYLNLINFALRSWKKAYILQRSETHIWISHCEGRTLTHTPDDASSNCKSSVSIVQQPNTQKLQSIFSRWSVNWEYISLHNQGDGWFINQALIAAWLNLFGTPINCCF